MPLGQPVSVVVRGLDGSTVVPGPTDPNLDDLSRTRSMVDSNARRAVLSTPFKSPLGDWAVLADSRGVIIERPDGSRVTVVVNIRPLTNHQREITGAINCFCDITERKAAEARIQSQLARVNLLHQITRAIGEREDLLSIYQVVLRSLEDQLGFDFGCIVGLLHLYFIRDN